MKVFKFGGASVKDAAGVKNLCRIVQSYQDDLVIVVSAIGKTTNHLERMLTLYLQASAELENSLQELCKLHTHILEELFPEKHIVFDKVNKLFISLKKDLQESLPINESQKYDELVAYGELLSTTIVSEYLIYIGRENEWLDIRGLLRTDENFKEGNVNWEESSRLLNEQLDFSQNSTYLTQGFIGGTASGKTTTLGREGSDYTGAILANVLGAESLSIWKDVPGVLNADPKWLTGTEKLPVLSYQEAIELAYFGAKVIHPKTLKPLQNEGIPLHVRSFINPEQEGTIIDRDELDVKIPSCFIRKENQTLVSITPKDLSFVLEASLSKIFALFHKYRMKVNLVQTSAVSFSVCIDASEQLKQWMEEASNEFSIRYNDNLELITIRHYTKEAIDRVTNGSKIYVEQKTRSTTRFVLKN